MESGAGRLQPLVHSYPLPVTQPLVPAPLPSTSAALPRAPSWTPRALRNIDLKSTSCLGIFTMLNCRVLSGTYILVLWPVEKLDLLTDLQWGEDKQVRISRLPLS